MSNRTYWAIQWESPEGFDWALENYWDGRGDLPVFTSQHEAERGAWNLAKRTGARTRVRQIKYEK